MKRKNLYPLSISAILMVFFGHFGFAQNAPMLVKDILTGSTSSNPTNFLTLGTKLYFMASVGTTNQLYQSDGTANGTAVVEGYDANNGLLATAPVIFNGQVYFAVHRTNRQNQGTTILLYKTNSNTAVFVDTLVNNNVPPSTSTVVLFNIRVQNNLLYYDVKTELFNQANTSLVRHTGQAGGKKVLGIIASGSSLSGTLSSNVNDVFIGVDYVYLFGESSSSTSGSVNRGRTISVININDAVPTPRILSPYTVNYGSVPPAVATYRGLGELGNEGYFTRNDTLFSVDIRGVGKILKTGVGQPNSVQKVGNSLYFTNNNNQLWRVGSSIIEVVQINTALQANESLGLLSTDGTEVYINTTLLGVFPALRRIVGNTLSGSNGTGQEGRISSPFFANGNAYVITSPNTDCIQGLLEYNPTTNQSKYYPILSQSNCSATNEYLKIGNNYAVTSNNLLFLDLNKSATGRELWKVDLNTPSVSLPNLKSGGWLFSNTQRITGLSAPPNVFIKGYDSFTPLAGSVQGMNLPTTAINPKLRLYISADNTIDANDFVFTTKTLSIVPNVGPNEYFAEGASNIVGATFNQIPANFPEGNYKLIAKIDADNAIGESDENDNIDIGTVTVVGTDYCASKSTLPWEYWVSNVKLGTINNTSDKFKDYNTAGYSDYTNLTTTVSKGKSYPLSISPGLSWIGNVPNAYARAWIDFNNNKTFEPGELVLEKTNANPLTANVLVPTTAVTGNVRMRIALKFGAYPTACETFDKGEVEDYTINIQGGGTVLPDFTTTIDEADVVNINNSFVFGLQGSYSNLSTIGANNVNFKIYISRDSFISADDKISYQENTSFSNLPIPDRRSISFDLQNWSSGTGNFFIIAVVDENNAIAESNELNNRFIYPLTVISNPCANDATPPVFANCPQNINLNITGTRAFASWTPPTATDNCTLVSNLGTINPPFSFGLGSTPVVYTATDAKNNTSTCRFNVVLTQSPTTILPDLTFTAGNILNNAVKSGDSLKYNFSVYNAALGGTPANTNFIMQGYISTDNVLSANDIATNPVSIFGQTIAKQVYLNGTTYVTVPTNLTAGTYFLLSKIDASNVITESNEGNNVIVLGSFTVTAPPTGNYCTSKGTAPWEQWIENVFVNAYDFGLTSKEGYGNFTTAPVAPVRRVQPNEITIIPKSSWGGNPINKTLFWRAWIDWNNDGDFNDANETIVSRPVTIFNGVFLDNNVSFSVPDGSTYNGKTRLRIAMKVGDYPMPCETFDKGEVEDYIINIQGVVTDPCLNDVTPPIISNCPQNIVQNVSTLGAVFFNWTPPTVTDNCTAQPSLSFTLKQGSSILSQSPAQVAVALDRSKPIDTVVYTAIDARGNRSTCSFQLKSNNLCDSFPKIGNLPRNLVLNTTGNCATFKWEVPTVRNFCYPCQYVALTLTSTTPSVSVVRLTPSCAQTTLDSACFPIGKTVLTYLKGDGTTDSLVVVVQKEALNCTNPTNIYQYVINREPSNALGLVLYEATTAMLGTAISQGIRLEESDGIVFSAGYTSSQRLFFAKNGSTTPISGVTYPTENTISGTWLYFSNVYGALRNPYSSVRNYFPDSITTGQRMRIKYFGSATAPDSLYYQIIKSDGSLDFLRKSVKRIQTCDACRNDATAPTFINCKDTIATGPVSFFNIPQNFATDNCAADTLIWGNPLIFQNQSAFSYVGNNETIVYTAFDGAGNISRCTVKVIIQTNPVGSDIAFSIAATPSVYRPFSSNTFKITAQNIGNQTVANAKIEFKFPAKTVTGGAVKPSIGTWQEWCAGGVQCFTWTIPTLAANSSATLDVPLFIQDAVGNIVATTKLLSSTPVDGNAANNTASVTLSPSASAPAIQYLSRQKPTQYIPIIVQSITPNPTEGDVVIEVESLKEQVVQFEFSNTMGQVIRSEKRPLEKGTNQVKFDVYEFPDGVYLIQTDVNRGRISPTKFVKF